MFDAALILRLLPVCTTWALVPDSMRLDLFESNAREGYGRCVYVCRNISAFFPSSVPSDLFINSTFCIVRASSTTEFVNNACVVGISSQFRRRKACPRGTLPLGVSRVDICDSTFAGTLSLSLNDRMSGAVIIAPDDLDFVEALELKFSQPILFIPEKCGVEMLRARSESPLINFRFTSGDDLETVSEKSAQDMSMPPFNWMSWFTHAAIFPTVICVGLLVCVLLIQLVVKIVRDYRKRAKHRLSRSMLHKLPTRKFNKGDPTEVCAICLDEYEAGEKLRVLPCRHDFHAKCVDPWLLKNKRICPMCKQRVLPRSVSPAETDNRESIIEDEGDRSPLIPRPSSFRNLRSFLRFERSRSQPHPSNFDNQQTTYGSLDTAGRSSLPGAGNNAA